MPLSSHGELADGSRLCTEVCQKLKLHSGVDSESCEWREFQQSWVDAVISVCCTQCMLYLVYAVLGLCCTRCMLYLVYAVVGVCCTWCMLYLVYAVLGVYSTWCMLYMVHAVLGECCTQCMLDMVFAILGECCTRCRLMMIMAWRERDGWLNIVFSDDGWVADEKGGDGGWRWEWCGGYKRIREIRDTTCLIVLGRPHIGVNMRQLVTPTWCIGDGKLTRTQTSPKSQFLMIISPVSSHLSLSCLQLYHHLRTRR